MFRKKINRISFLGSAFYKWYAIFFSLMGCLQIPDLEEEQILIKDISVSVIQNNKESNELMIRPEEIAFLKANVAPLVVDSCLIYEWHYISEYENDIKDSLIAKGSIFKIQLESDVYQIPNRLVVKDKEGNFLKKDFQIEINSYPYFVNDLEPKRGDTLYGKKNTAFLFSWKAYDRDGDDLEYGLKIDSTFYKVGALENLKQSGFDEGKHFYRVYVKDSKGAIDSTEKINFFVFWPLENK